ncbi:tyrosinase [Colletotrichum spaethianum]|uniref:tyrosinase n=1 Tax=Colletotrichum spaethianum TaxID=700344 RepID=A0AA37LFE2_9PEZI|nr:tyrosinase [Colletotrichum spaethianum]GKT45419.1 tyrosinase [Colletotrichum spaethianum]
MSAPFQTYAITGIPTEGTGPPPSRSEINAWAKQNPIQLSLFIQALRAFQSMDFRDQLSYYRIAGIHGLPATSWDNDPIPIEVTNSYGENYPDHTPDFYCPHNTLIFPTWHRAYLLLFEQRLWEIMTKEIVPAAPSSAQQQWMTEANAWRLPYWDWANIPSVPDVASTPTITIKMPDGTSQED